MKKAVTVVLIFVLVTSLLVGCSSKSTPSDSNNASLSSGVGTVTAGASANISGKDKYGGVLTISPGVQSEQNLGDPAGNTNMLMIYTGSPAVESMFRMDSKGNIIPWLIEKYEISDDGLTYTFHVRQNVYFHDGTLMDAKAIAWNIQNCITGKKAEYQRVSSVNPTDQYTLEIKMSKPDALLLANMAGTTSGLIVSPTSYQKNGKDWATKNPIGTGPFVFSSWDNDVKAVYKKNPNYWGKDAQGNKLPYLDGVEVDYMAQPSVAEAALQAGELLAWCRADSDSVQKFQNISGFIAQKAEAPTADYVLTGCNKDPNSVTANESVREAVACAVDWQTIVNSVFNVSCTYTNQDSLPGRIFYNDKITIHKYDPNYAKQLLAKAGYSNGVTIPFYATTDSVQQKLLTAMQPYLSAVGITMDMKLMEAGGWFQVMSASFNNGFLLSGINYSPNEFGKMYALLSASSNLPIHNFSLDDSTNQLFETAKSCKTMDEAANYVKQIQEDIYGKNCYQISVMTQFECLIQKDSVKDAGFYEYTAYHWTPETAYIAK